MPCVRELVRLHERASEFQARRARLWAVAAEGRDTLLGLRRDLPHMVVIADAELAMIDAFDARHRGGRGSTGDCAYPTTIISDERGIVRWIGRPGNAFERLGPDAVLQALDEVDRRL